MKILLTYLRPYKWLVVLTMVLAALNTGFSLVDPIIFGKLVNLANDFANRKRDFTQHSFLFSFEAPYYGVFPLLLGSVLVATDSSMP
jgi:ATP-binding cassette subfamily B protein